MPDCSNCGSNAVENYCAHCGQRFQGGHSMREFVRSVADDQFGVDAKLPRTLKALFFQPGVMTRDFMEGRVARYIPPFRLYLISSLSFFVLLSFMMVRGDWGGAAGRQMEREIKAVTADSLAADSIHTDTARAPGRLRVRVSGGGQETWLKDATVNVPWKWLDRKIEQNLAALGALPPEVATRRVTTTVIEELPKVMFLLLPIFALLLKLLYVLKKRPYIEHFVFALHLHSFSFLLFTALLLYRSPILATVMGVIIAIYTFMAMKRVYRQGYAMTFIKWMTLGFAYSMAVMTGLSFALIWAFAATSAA